MIKCKLAILLGEKKINRRQLSLLTKVNENTIANLWFDRALRYNKKDINAICCALKCTPGDLFVWVPDEV